MNKHTPGPWFVDSDTEVTNEHRDFIATAHMPGSAVGTAVEYANAAHIVACVNACEGIDTDALAELPGGVAGLLAACEKGVAVVRGLRASDARQLSATVAMQAQRDELLAALKGLLAMLDGQGTLNTADAYAAIAKVQS